MKWMLGALAAAALATTAAAATPDQLEANKKAVLAFYDAALNQKDFEKASQYLRARYTQQSLGGGRSRWLKGLHRLSEGEISEQSQRD